MSPATCRTGFSPCSTANRGAKAPSYRVRAIRRDVIVVVMKKETRKDLRSARRAAHFRNGGTLAEWRGGLSTRITNKKRQASKDAARGKANRGED